MMLEMLQYGASILIVGGGVFSLLAAVGILRLPELFTRMHSASKAGVVGAGLILLAVALVSLDGPVILRAILGLLFLVLTTPVSAHLLARAAYQAGIRPGEETEIDDLEADRQRESRHPGST